MICFSVRNKGRKVWEKCLVKPFVLEIYCDKVSCDIIEFHARSILVE